MKSQQKEKVKQIADFYGIESRLNKTLEELGELTEEVINYQAGFMFGDEDNITTKKIADEMADVKIMIKQLEYLLECEQEVKDRVEFKLNRQIGRMEEERGNY